MRIESQTCTVAGAIGGIVKKHLSDGQKHNFGGEWTTKKLEAIRKYLHEYTTALKNQHFTTMYIDAFAGTGSRAAKASTTSDTGELLFPELAEAESAELLDGSARIALKTEPRFSEFIFIDIDQRHCATLEELKRQFPEHASDIHIINAEANAEIQRICVETNWRQKRAVLFLDPYGMQVEWGTIERVAKTQAIDMWLLFPLGIGVNRLLTRSGELPQAWRESLNRLLGTHEWENAFYKVERTPTLFGGDEEHVVKASLESIGEFFQQRLRSVFPAVAEKPGVLRNSTGSPLYLLCFAAGNSRGGEIALRIARHILKAVQ